MRCEGTHRHIPREVLPLLGCLVLIFVYCHLPTRHSSGVSVRSIASVSVATPSSAVFNLA